jgi:hypothetical protein
MSGSLLQKMVSRNTSTAGIAALMTPSLRVDLSVEIWAGRTILTRPLLTTLPVPMKRIARTRLTGTTKRRLGQRRFDRMVDQ